MATLGAKGFWSYAHSDDESERGRIRQLAGLMRAEYRLLVGHDLDLFLDRDAIEWGENWRDRIEESLSGITFFIPIVTPTYFAREECRKELLKFAREAKRLGVEELLLPIIYIEVPGLDESSPDEALAAVARPQWEDWTELRLEDFESPTHRQAVNRLARRLRDIGDLLADRPVVIPIPDVSPTDAMSAMSVEGKSEELGILDKVVLTEQTMPEFATTVQAIGDAFNKMNDLTEHAAAEMQHPDVIKLGFAGRLGVANRLAQQLDEPADEILELGTRFASQLLAVDAGVLELIRMAGAAESDEDRQNACEGLASIREMVTVSKEALGSFRELSGTLDETAGFSRELRRPLTKIQDGLRRVIDAQAVMEEWEREIDRSPLDCSEMPAPD